MSVTDKRVQTMNELVTYIRLIKMYAWEKSFTKSILGRTHSGSRERLPCRTGSYGSCC